MGKGKDQAKGGLWDDPEVRGTKIHSLKNRHKDLILLYLAMLAFKLALDFGYLWLALHGQVGFVLNFSPIKYAVGLVCCTLIFFSIRHSQRKASAFFLYFVFLFQIIPITSAYAMADQNSSYYLVLVLSYLLCCIFVGYTWDAQKYDRNAVITKTFALGCVAVTALIVGIIVLRYGMPSLTALNIYSVYELRASNAFVLGKYENYLFRWATSVILPAGIALCITKRKSLIALGLSGVMLALYLYSGHKTFLFSIPLVIVCTFWSRREAFYKEIFLAGCFGCFLLVLLLWFSPVLENLVQRVFSLLVRRVMLVPANNKFHYYDYFTNNPHMGLGGIFPRWLLSIPNYYENIPYSYEISAIYYNKPDMNSNTGFLAEGYMRFGHFGTIFILLLFGSILKQIDHFQERVGYPLAVGVFIYQIYSLTDLYLLDSFVFGSWMLLVAFLFLCGRGQDDENIPSRWKLKRIRFFREKRGK